MNWRRLIELRVSSEAWVLTPSFEERLVRLSFPESQGIQSVLVSQSPSFYPVQISNVRAFNVKPESDIFEISINFFPELALAFKAISTDYKSRSGFVRVLIEVAPKPASPGSSQDEAQDVLLAQHSQLLAQHSQDIAQLQVIEPWQALTLENGWSDFGPPYSTAGWRKEGNLILLRGVVKTASLASATIATLPTGSRPGNRKVYVNATANPDGSVGVGLLVIDANGEIVFVAGGLAQFSLDGTVFTVGE